MTSTPTPSGRPESPGRLIAFEGLDQSGKATQVDLLARRLRDLGLPVHVLEFPDYSTPVGAEIGACLRGDREYPPDVLQLLYIANRYEHRGAIAGWLTEGSTVICDRYLASSIAYGEAQGLDPRWLEDTQRHLPPPALTILLDIAPETALRRKQAGRDRYERDVALLTRVRRAYRTLAGRPSWALVDGERPEAEVASAVLSVVAERLALR